MALNKNDQIMSMESLTNLKTQVAAMSARRKSSVFNTEELGLLRESVASRMSFSSGNLNMKSQLAQLAGKLENTYKQEPDSAHNWFGPDGEKKLRMLQISEMAERCLENALYGEEYEMFKCRQLCCGLADDIKRRVQNMQNFPQRHKIIVNVYVGELTESSEIRVASQGLTLKYDSFAEAVFRGKHVMAVAVVYLVYQD